MKICVLRYLLLLAVMLTVVVSAMHPAFANHKAKEDSHTAMLFHALSDIDIELSTEHLDNFRRVFDKLQNNPRFQGGIIYDPDLNPVFIFPDGYEIPDSALHALEEIAAHVTTHSSGKIEISEVIEDHVSYKIAIPDYAHGIIGYVILSYQY